MVWEGEGVGKRERCSSRVASIPSLEAQLPKGCQTPAPAALTRRQFDTSCGRASAVPTTWSVHRKDEACIPLLPILLASSLSDACSPGNWSRRLVDCACPASKPITSPFSKQFSVALVELVRPASLAHPHQCTANDLTTAPAHSTTLLLTSTTLRRWGSSTLSRSTLDAPRSTLQA